MKRAWQGVVFAVAIALIYVPMVFLGVNTFFPELENPCRAEIPVKACQLLEGNETAFRSCMAEQDAKSEEARGCFDTFDKERNRHEGFMYITTMIICLVTSFMLLLSLDKSVIYGLFFGVVLTAFIATIRYLRARSLIGFILLVVLFFVIIFFIQKQKKGII